MTDAASNNTALTAEEPESRSDQAEYRVLARKYRPKTFDELVGQDVLVRTLRHAIRTDRVAHAFMLTGVRGIGKTTTARIIARALNCVGPDGTGGPTDSPCGVCEYCVAITEDRHVDVIEMDAASHTGVDNIRDLTDSVRYRPVSARYKIYIIDEVHMLSKAAFNALLKTLEEPPEHLKFVFATTEIRKVPITVLSRCQRFDLRRLDTETMVGHLGKVATDEEAKVEEGALRLLARASDGSVRDGLSLLDQAIAQAAGNDIDAGLVRGMIGLADRNRTLDLFEMVMGGDARGALELADELYRAGADPLVILNDLLDITHGLTRRKLGAGPALDAGGDEERAARMAETLGIAILSRAWQMLLKGVGEVQMAAAPLTALEMLLVRLAYVADLPPPGDIVRALESSGADKQAAAPAVREAPRSSSVQTSGTGGSAGAPRPAGGAARSAAQPVERHVEQHEQSPSPDPEQARMPGPATFLEVAQLFEAKRELQIYHHLLADVHPVHFEPGRIEFRPGPMAPNTLANRIGDLLSQWTGERWVVSVSQQKGGPTLREQAEAEAAERRSRAAEDPLVQAVFDAFPGARIEAVRPLSPAPEGDIEGDFDDAADENDEETP